MLLCVVQNYNQITDRGGTTLFLRQPPHPEEYRQLYRIVFGEKKHLLDYEQSLVNYRMLWHQKRPVGLQSEPSFL